MKRFGGCCRLYRKHGSGISRGNEPAEDTWRDVRQTRPSTARPDSEGDRHMKTLWGLPALAVLLTALAAGTAQAACCGAANYSYCGCCDSANYSAARQQCHTVMKTCREVVYE